MLSREDFCKLTEIPSIEALKSRAKRSQLPVSIENESRKSYGYSFFDAFVTILADRLADSPIHANQVSAASIARAVAPILAQNWKAIAASGARVIAATEKPEQEIKWLHVWSAAGTGNAVLVGASLAVSGAVTDAIGGNASRSAAILIMRAQKLGIALPIEFWNETPAFLQGEFETVAESWSRAVEAVNIDAAAKAKLPSTKSKKRKGK